MSATVGDLRWISEPKMLEVIELPRSTFQGWIRAGIVERDPGGAYGFGEVIELVLVATLREYFSVEDLAVRWPKLRRAGEVDVLVSRAGELEPGGRYDLVVEMKHGGVALATDDHEIAEAVRYPGAPRPVVVIDVAPRVLRARDGFDAWQVVARRPLERKVGRPSKRRTGDVRELPAR